MKMAAHWIRTRNPSIWMKSYRSVKFAPNPATMSTARVEADNSGTPWLLNGGNGVWHTTIIRHSVYSHKGIYANKLVITSSIYLVCNRAELDPHCTLMRWLNGLGLRTCSQLRSRLLLARPRTSRPTSQICVYPSCRTCSTWAILFFSRVFMYTCRVTTKRAVTVPVYWSPINMINWNGPSLQSLVGPPESFYRYPPGHFPIVSPAGPMLSQQLYSRSIWRRSGLVCALQRG